MGAPDGDESRTASDVVDQPEHDVPESIWRGGLKRGTKIQLILFVVITLLGVSYVSAKYVGLAKWVIGGGCTVHADFPDSGGIFTNAEVTYRGVTVGQVSSLKLIKGGVQVDLKLDSCSDPSIPADSIATVADRSVVGEQYVDIAPPPGAAKDTNGPYLRDDASVGSLSTNKIPTATETLLVDLDRFLRSVPLNDLRTTIHELGNSFAGRGGDLGRLLDAADQFIAAASKSENVSATIQLIDESTSVLQTQLDQREPLRIWTHSLNLLSQQLKASNPDFEHLLDTGPADITTVTDFVKNNQTDIGVTLANLATVGDLLVRHLPGIEEIFEVYPLVAANGPTTIHDRVAWLGLVLQVKPDPQDCGDPDNGGEGYGGTVRRPPFNIAPEPPNVAAHCTAPNTGPNAKNVRGSAHVPGGDPISVSGGGYAYPRTTTKNVLRVGNPLPTTETLGDGSWLALVTASLH